MSINWFSKIQRVGISFQTFRSCHRQLSIASRRKLSNGDDWKKTQALRLKIRQTLRTSLRNKIKQAKRNWCPPDILHCVDLGVAKHFAQIWINTENHGKPFYLNDAQRTGLNHALECIKPPYRDVLPSQYYQHWLLLVDGISQMVKANASIDDIERGGLCLEDFSSQIRSLYVVNKFGGKTDATNHGICDASLAQLGFEVSRDRLQSSEDVLHRHHGSCVVRNAGLLRRKFQWKITFLPDSMQFL
ncbi:unnamed protein product [Allacma fusca]|uniref:Uncharacterized protein n=1 Tax=Allacma fusca TaxID=39272 RepID=A0A8J2PLK0_9HEXA|nr:unnamed protein product [Allacma fusca]